MTKTDVELSARDGFAEDYSHPLVEALRGLRAAHGLRGCVLVSFDEDRVAVNTREPILRLVALKQAWAEQKDE